ncbi:hypothetical protein AUC68_00535 [Methyloceanibacter methanicus]|uniref:Uncharacterized protein n=2 Tax=Methyloceanibacter methanicus TaxID=1774968 RepID=A0A1E3W6F0_9HYPH|nr:hypothetical protein AUC68_00535 [Methyloceanibacter methanicus]
MPSAIVLIVCKTVVAGPADQNAAYTGYENLEWATEHSMMVCRRQKVDLYDPAVDGGFDVSGKRLPAAAPQPFNQQRCQRAGITLGVNWDQAHRGSKYRFWRVACPVPIVDTRTGEVIAWKMPECGRRDIVVCEVDTAI